MTDADKTPGGGVRGSGDGGRGAVGAEPEGWTTREGWRELFALARPGHEAHFERAIDSIMADPWGAYANEIRITANQVRSRPPPSPSQPEHADDRIPTTVVSAEYFDWLVSVTTPDPRYATDLAARFNPPSERAWPVGERIEPIGYSRLGERRWVRDGRRLVDAWIGLQRRAGDLKRQLDALLRRNGVPR